MTEKLILIIEDDEDIRQSLVDILGDEGYLVISAANGHEGLCLLNQGTRLPALIFLDANMPVLDGFGFRTRQLENPRISAIPTVLFSADGQAFKRTAELGVTEIVKKPVDLEIIFALVRKYCS